MCVCARSTSLADQSGPNSRLPWPAFLLFLSLRVFVCVCVCQVKSLADQAGPNSGPVETGEIAHMFSFHYTHLEKTITKHVSIFFFNVKYLEFVLFFKDHHFNFMVMLYYNCLQIWVVLIYKIVLYPYFFDKMAAINVCFSLYFRMSPVSICYSLTDNPGEDYDRTYCEIRILLYAVEESARTNYKEKTKK